MSSVTIQDVCRAGADLRSGRITVDEYREIMREGRGQHAPQEWDRIKFHAARVMLGGAA